MATRFRNVRVDKLDTQTAHNFLLISCSPPIAHTVEDKSNDSYY